MEIREKERNRYGVRIKTRNKANGKTRERKKGGRALVDEGARRVNQVDKRRDQGVCREGGRVQGVKDEVFSLTVN